MGVIVCRQRGCAGDISMRSNAVYFPRMNVPTLALTMACPSRGTKAGKESRFTVQNRVKRTKTGGTREQSTLEEGAMPRANLNLPPKDDMGSKIVPWEKRHAAGKDLGRSVLRESHSEWVPPKDRPVLKHTSKR